MSDRNTPEQTGAESQSSIQSTTSQWDRRFIELASFVSGWSKDRSRKVGCVIVDAQRGVRAIGYNGFPRGIEDDEPERHERPAKYMWTEHAERNAIYQAARMGVSLEGCTMYLPWFPCIDCARAIVQSGIIRLVAERPDLTDPQWGSHFTAAIELLSEAQVQVDWMDDLSRTSALSMHGVPELPVR